MRLAGLAGMNTPQFREHLAQVHSSYEAMVEGNRLEDLDRELMSATWMPMMNGASPSPDVIEVTGAIMSELHAAAAKRDKSGARSALARLRRLIQMIDVAAPEGFARQ